VSRLSVIVGQEVSLLDQRFPLLHKSPGITLVQEWPKKQQ
jgi:hypothetical protein